MAQSDGPCAAEAAQRLAVPVLLTGSQGGGEVVTASTSGTRVTAMLRPLQRMTTIEAAASADARDILKQKEIGDFWVSSQSRWGDRLWQLDNETAGARPQVSRIHWDVALPDGD